VNFIEGEAVESTILKENQLQNHKFPFFFQFYDNSAHLYYNSD